MSSEIQINKGQSLMLHTDGGNWKNETVCITPGLYLLSRIGEPGAPDRKWRAVPDDQFRDLERDHTRLEQENAALQARYARLAKAAQLAIMEHEDTIREMSRDSHVAIISRDAHDNLQNTGFCDIFYLKDAEQDITLTSTSSNLRDKLQPLDGERVKITIEKGL